MNHAITWLVVLPYSLFVSLSAFWIHRHFRRVGERKLSLLVTGVVILVVVTLAALVAGFVRDYVERMLAQSV